MGPHKSLLSADQLPRARKLSAQGRTHGERIFHFHQPGKKLLNYQGTECRVSAVGKQLLAQVSLNKARLERIKTTSAYLTIYLVLLFPWGRKKHRLDDLITSFKIFLVINRSENFLFSLFCKLSKKTVR